MKFFRAFLSDTFCTYSLKISVYFLKITRTQPNSRVPIYIHTPIRATLWLFTISGIFFFFCKTVTLYLIQFYRHSDRPLAGPSPSVKKDHSFGFGIWTIQANLPRVVKHYRDLFSELAITFPPNVLARLSNRRTFPTPRSATADTYNRCFSALPRSDRKKEDKIHLFILSYFVQYIGTTCWPREFFLSFLY